MDIPVPKVAVESQAEKVEDPLINLSVSPVKLSPNLVELSETWSIKTEAPVELTALPLAQGSKGWAEATAAAPLYLNVLEEDIAQLVYEKVIPVLS